MDYNQAFFLYTLLVKIADALTVLAVWYLSWYLRFSSQLIPALKGIPSFKFYSKVSLPLLLVFSAMFHVVGAYRRDRIHFGFRSLKKVVQGSIVGTLVFIAICYFLEEFHFSRVYLALFPILAVVGLSLERALLHLAWEYCEVSLVKKIRILLIGTGELLQMYVQKISERKPYPLSWIGRLGPATDEDLFAENLQPSTQIELNDVPYLGTEEALAEVIQENKIDLAVVSYPTDSTYQYGKILETLSNELVDVRVLPDFGKYSTFTYSATHECGIPLLIFNQPPLGTTDRFFKRLFDIVGSVLFLIVFSPLYLLIALLVKLTSKGPVFYSQLRIGADEKIFPCYKFRSMEVDAEKVTGAVWATQNDPRTTRLGKWLRKTSLDELPQFYNVLKGDMSLVGPRPERPVFVNQFRKEIPKYMLRHRMKSGITGWAQVNGWRGNTSIEERIKHDLYYIGHWSHYFDIKILCLTLSKGFVNHHAY